MRIFKDLFRMALRYPLPPLSVPPQFRILADDNFAKGEARALPLQERPPIRIQAKRQDPERQVKILLIQQISFIDA